MYISDVDLIRYADMADVLPLGITDVGELNKLKAKTDYLVPSPYMMHSAGVIAKAYPGKPWDEVWPKHAEKRKRVFAACTPIGNFLRENPISVKIGKYLFSHAGSCRRRLLFLLACMPTF